VPVPFANAFHTAGSMISRVTTPITSRLGRRGTRVMRYVGIVVLALLVFVFALQATFPYERLKDRAIEAIESSYDVQVGSVERGIIPGNVTFHDVTLRSRPASKDEVPMLVVVKQLDVKLGLLAVLGMNASIDLDLTVGNPAGYGHIKGNLTFPKFGKAGVKIALEGDDLPGATLPLRNLLGLPMTGKLGFAIDLDLPVTKNKMGRSATDWSKAEGTLDLTCATGCTLGDGHTKLKPLLKNHSNQVMVGDGIDFGEAHISSLDVHAVFTAAVGDPDAHSSSYKAGKFEVTKFELKSPDGELHVDYLMTMATTLDESVVTGCLRFKPNDILLKKEETKRTYAAISTTGAELRSDGLFHIKLSDRFKDMKRLNAECGPNAAASKIGNGEDFTAHPNPTGRPTIQAMPDRGSAVTAPPPPPPPITPPPPPPPTAMPAGSAHEGSSNPTAPGSGTGSTNVEGAAAGAGSSGSAEVQHVP
jgi:type II secretion system protein N